MADTKARDSWYDISDAELRARLKMIGMGPTDRAVFLHYRRNEHFARQIDQLIG